MKKNFFIGVLPLLLGVMSICFASCGDDKDEDKNIKAVAPTASAQTINAGGTITFTDNSTGVASRTWTFPSGTPATSTEATANVTFNFEGPTTITLVNKFNDGTTKTQTLKVQVGTELLSRYSAGFEGDTCLNIWSYWCPSKSDSAAYEISIDKTQGTNNSSRSLKIVVKSSGHEIQLFSVPKSGAVNDFGLELSPTQKYVFSYWVKSADFVGYIDNANNSGTFAHDVVNKSEDDKVAANRQRWGDYAWGNMAVSSTWAKVIQNFGPKDLYSGAKTKNAYAFFKFVPSKTGTLYIDEVSIKPDTSN
jgi:PKD repeat protein